MFRVPVTVSEYMGLVKFAGVIYPYLVSPDRGQSDNAKIWSVNLWCPHSSTPHASIVILWASWGHTPLLQVENEMQVRAPYGYKQHSCVCGSG